MTVTIQFLVAMMDGRESFQEKLLATIPDEGAGLINLRARPNILESRKALFAQSTADYIAMVDDDDKLGVGVPAVIQYVKRMQPESLMTGSTKIDIHGTPIGVFNDLNGVTYANFLSRIRMPHQLFICTREVAQKAIDAAEAYVLAQNDPLALQAFDVAYNWEILLQGTTKFFQSDGYRWRIHRPKDQLHGQNNPFLDKAIAFYRNKFKEKYDRSPD